MNDEELDIFWRLKRLEEKKNLFNQRFSDDRESVNRPMAKQTANNDRNSSYNIPEIRSNTFYQNYKEKHDRVLRRRTEPEQTNDESRRVIEIEKQRTTKIDNKIRKNFTLKPDINWFKVSVVLSLLLSVVLVTSFSLYGANRQIDTNLGTKESYIFDLEKQNQSLLKENQTLKELNDSLNLRLDSLRNQLVDARNSMYKLQSTYQNQMINEDYALYLALEFVNTDASKNLPVECGTSNPELIRVYYEKATIEKINKTFKINMPADLKYQSVTRYNCYIEMDESGNIVHWNWQKPS
jgi:cell division protein FtsB